MPIPRPSLGMLPLLLAVPLASQATARAEEQQPDLKTFVRATVADFHQRRAARLASLELATVIARKNPYLLKAKSLDTPRQFVTELLDSHLAPQEAGLFGTVMEQVALEVCRRTYGGRKSAIEGIDMEFERDGTRYIVSIKSGPNWGNASQIKQMGDYFRTAKKVLGTNSAQAAKVIAINGCCYGSTATEDRGDYLKLCGKNFWALISGNDQFYQDLIPLIGDVSGGQNNAFDAARLRAIDRFTTEFENDYCTADGAIRWQKIVELSSGER